MRKYIFLLILLTSQIALGQNNNSETDEKIKFFIGDQVVNAEGEDEKQIIELWKIYLLAGQYGDINSPYWSFENVTVPDEYLWALNLNNIQNNEHQTQCKIIGIFAVEHD
jgi:hypothetical protein